MAHLSPLLLLRAGKPWRWRWDHGCERAWTRPSSGSFHGPRATPCLDPSWKLWNLLPSTINKQKKPECFMYKTSGCLWSAVPALGTNRGHMRKCNIYIYICKARCMMYVRYYSLWVQSEPWELAAKRSDLPLFGRILGFQRHCVEANVLLGLWVCICWEWSKAKGKRPP